MEIDMTISVLGIDIAKNTFQLHGADCAGNPTLRKCLPRNKLAAFVANLPLIGKTNATFFKTPCPVYYSTARNQFKFDSFPALSH